LEVADVELPEAVADPLDVEAVSAVAVEAVASQEVDVVAAAASVGAVAVDLAVDVDEEDTKCFDLGRLSSHPDMLEKRCRLRCHFGSSLRLPTDTMIIWRRFGVMLGLYMSKIWRHVADTFETDAHSYFLPESLPSSISLVSLGIVEVLHVDFYRSDTDALLLHETQRIVICCMKYQFPTDITSYGGCSLGARTSNRHSEITTRTRSKSNVYQRSY